MHMGSWFDWTTSREVSLEYAVHPIRAGRFDPGEKVRKTAHESVCTREKAAHRPGVDFVYF